MATPSKKNEEVVKKSVKTASVKSPTTVAKKVATTPPSTPTKSMPVTQHEYSKKSHIILIILLVLNLVVGLYNIGNTKSSITEIEALKVGGMENYTKLTKLMKSDEYKKAHSENIEMMTMQIEQMKNEPSSGYLDNTTPGNVTSPQDISTSTPSTTDFESRSDG